MVNFDVWNSSQQLRNVYISPFITNCSDEGSWCLQMKLKAVGEIEHYTLACAKVVAHLIFINKCVKYNMLNTNKNYALKFAEDVL